MYFTLCIFSAGLRTEEPFAMLSGKTEAQTEHVRVPAPGYLGGQALVTSCHGLTSRGLQFCLACLRPAVGDERGREAGIAARHADACLKVTSGAAWAA